VTVEVVPTQVPFPAISICNMRNLDVFILNTLNSMFIQDDNPINNINKSDNHFIREYMSLVAKYAPLFYEHQMELPEVFQVNLFETDFVF
jgi:hypothetical protein